MDANFAFEIVGRITVALVLVGVFVLACEAGKAWWRRRRQGETPLANLEGITMKRRRRERNRVSTFTRWPADPMARLERAQRDVDFVKALAKCGVDVLEIPELNQIVIKAGTESVKAQKEL
jgi:hypothetical protein